LARVSSLSDPKSTSASPSLTARARDAARRVDPWTALLVAVVSAVAFVILAILATVLWLSLRVGDPGDPDAVYSIANYTGVFRDSFTYKVIGNTLGFSTVTLVVAFLFGVPAAWLSERTDLPAKPLLYTFMSVGLLVPGFAAAMGWLFLLHPRIGMINTWLIDVFHLAEPPLNIATIVGMGWIQGLNLAPIAFIMTAAVFRAMDPSLEEAAEMNGASGLKTFWRITLKLAWPGLLAAGIYIFTIGFAAFDVPAIIGWSNRVFTFSTYLLLETNPAEGLPQYGRAAALATFVIALGCALSWWYARLQSQGHRYQVVTGKGYRPRLGKLGRHALTAWAFIGIYFSLSKLLPLAVLIWASLLPFFQLPSATALKTISLANFNAIPWDLTWLGLKNTLVLMVLTPTVTLALCLAFSWVVLRSRVPGRALFDVVAFLPHTVPNVVFGIGALLIALFVLSDFIPLYGTIWILLVVFVITRLSYGTRMTNSTLMQIHRDLEESAMVSGARTKAVLWRIVLPLLRPTLVYAWLWIALLTYRELTLAVLLSTRGNITLPVVVWSVWQGGAFGRGAALTLVTLVFLLPFIVLYWTVARRRAVASSS
jgi:iron(III) transport system permease protein